MIYNNFPEKYYTCSDKQLSQALSRRIIIIKFNKRERIAPVSERAII